MDRKPFFSTEHLCELCLRNVCTMVLMVANPLLGFDLVLNDGKIEFRGFLLSYGESFQDQDAGATMGTHCHHTRDPKGGGKFRGKE